jgi:hypothetical protein
VQRQSRDDEEMKKQFYFCIELNSALVLESEAEFLWLSEGKWKRSVGRVSQSDGRMMICQNVWGDISRF